MEFFWFNDLSLEQEWSENNIANIFKILRGAVVAEQSRLPLHGTGGLVFKSLSRKDQKDLRTSGWKMSNIVSVLFEDLYFYIT